MIYDREHYDRSLGLLLSGAVQVIKTEGEHHLIMSALKPGDLFGAAALFYHTERYETRLYASHDCKVLFIRQEGLEKMMREEPKLALNYISYLTQRIHFLNGKIEGLIAGECGAQAGAVPS